MDACYDNSLGASTGTVRLPPLPLLIGTDFHRKIGQTNFHKAQHFLWVDHDVSLLSEGKLPSSNQSTIIQTPFYAQGEAPLVPPWVAFNKETLVFDAFFKESIQEYPNSPYLPRFVKIYYFLEDGSLQVVEPRTNNSGLHQGVFLRRQRVRLPNSARTDEFIDITDLNVGQELELFGRVFKITNCDRFTRNFLNRNGICVPDPVKPPDDPYLKIRQKNQLSSLPKKPKKTSNDMRQFLKFDRCVLRFYGYWDDRDMDGDLHKLVLQYYLSDDTIEVKHQQGDQTGGNPTLLSRQRLPMDTMVPGPGQYDVDTVLNVLTEDNMSARFVYDSLSCGGKLPKFYTAADLAIGGVVNVMGRKVVLCDCDKYTQDYYRINYGLDSFEPLTYPDDGETSTTVELKKELPPPYNGFGTYEDSLSNCLSVVPKRANLNSKQKLEESRDGYDSHILRFAAKITKNNRSAHRKFIISFFLEDDTLSVYEQLAHLNPEGPSGQIFFSRSTFLKPGENKYGCKKPSTYTREDCWVGATLVLNEFTFQLVEADEYTLRYMELNTLRFPKSNANIIMEKIRRRAKPVYRQFVSKNFALSLECGIIPFCKFRKALLELLGEDLEEQEILTVARKYRVKVKTTIDVWTVRHKIHCHFKKLITVIDKVSLSLYFEHCDPDKTGTLPRHIILRCMKGAHVPLPEIYMEEMLDCMKPDENGNISYMEVLDFMDYFSSVPCKPYGEHSWMSQEKDNNIIVDLNAFLRDLNLDGSEQESYEC